MERQDGYYNAVVGHGLQSKDPMANYAFAGNRLVSFSECDDLYTYNGMCRKIIDTPAKEALKCGFELMDGEELLERNDDVQSRLEDIHIKEVISQALSWDRLFGGAAILMIVNDGAELIEPLAIERVKGFEKLMLFDPQDITVSKRYDDASKMDFGKPEILALQNEIGGSFFVHESRVILLDGEAISNKKRAARDGWGGKVLDTIANEVQRYDSGLSLSLTALSRLSQGILKLEGLADMLSRDGGEEIVRKRLHMIDMARHIMNTVAISSEDEYDQKNLTTSGIKDIIEQFQYSLSAVTSIPATVLFGRAPSGENSTGEADFEAYYNMVKRIQETKVKPILLRLIEIVDIVYGLKLPEAYTLKFGPLWNESAKEEAEAENIRQQAMEHRANAANTFVSMGALDAQEVRNSLKEDGCYVIDDSLDELLNSVAEESEQTPVGENIENSAEEENEIPDQP